MGEMKLLVIAPATSYEPGPFGDLLTRLAEDAVETARREGWTPTLIGLEDCGDHRWQPALAAADAVVILGGHDVDPRLYGGPLDYPGSGDHLVTADRRALIVIQACRADRRPLLGICRGMHLINVAYGGDLIPHLVTHLNHRRPEGDPMRDHLVDVAPESSLAAVLPERQVTVRSSHHQAIGVLGRGLKPVAWATHDGVIEAVEDPERPVLAVQWHPEDQGAEPDQLPALLGWLAAELRDATERERPAS